MGDEGFLWSRSTLTFHCYIPLTINYYSGMSGIEIRTSLVRNGIGEPLVGFAGYFFSVCGVTGFSSVICDGLVITISSSILSSSSSVGMTDEYRLRLR